jgi:nicotinate-nucleotide pyrophosphorylase (carboxylating)
MSIDTLLAEWVQSDVERALREDVGSGDLTARLIPEQSESKVTVVCRESAVICGTAWFNESFHRLDSNIGIEWLARDGDVVEAGSVICRLNGNTRALLTGERCALNFLQTLSGTATLAARYAKAVEGTGVRLLDTRKTIPGLRMAQKYAVQCGGCSNHRIGLFDAMLIKENHIAAAGSITNALNEAAQAVGPGIEIEIEVESLQELQEALQAGAKRVMLDNFSLDRLREAVALNAKRARLEASGNVDFDTIRSIAETGVDDISIGGLTKSVQAIDLSMRFID